MINKKLLFSVKESIPYIKKMYCINGLDYQAANEELGRRETKHFYILQVGRVRLFHSLTNLYLLFLPLLLLLL